MSPKEDPGWTPYSRNPSATSTLATRLGGDRITIDAESNTITLDVSADDLANRRKSWTAPPYKAVRGTLYKYIKNVKSASEGCVTDE